MFQLIVKKRNCHCMDQTSGQARYSKQACIATSTANTWGHMPFCGHWTGHVCSATVPQCHFFATKMLQQASKVWVEQCLSLPPPTSMVSCVDELASGPLSPHAIQQACLSECSGSAANLCSSTSFQNQPNFSQHFQTFSIRQPQDMLAGALNLAVSGNPH